MDSATALGVVGIVVGVLGVASAVAVPVVQHRREKRRHVRRLWARLEHLRRSADGTVSHWVYGGGRLTLRNDSRWPLRDVMVMAPEVLAGQDFPLIGPYQEHTLDIPDATMLAIPLNDMDVTVQVTDSNARCWRWTPAQDILEPIPPPINPVARFVQWTARRWPESWHRNFARLPISVVRVLWGYDPRG